MNDEQIMQRGGDESDIEAYANQNGANLTKFDVEMEKKIQEQQFMTRRNSELIVVNEEPMLAYNGLKLDEQVEANMLVAYNHTQHFIHQELQKARERYENILTPLLETMSDPRAGSTWNELAKEIQAELDQPNN